MKNNYNSQKFGVEYVMKLPDNSGDYFDDVTTATFETRTQAYLFIKRCEMWGDKVVNRIGF